MTAEQRDLWERVIERDGGRCLFCGQPGSEVHHIISRRYRGAWDIRNMCVLCRACHSRAHSKRMRGALLAMMARRYGYDYSDPPWAGLLAAYGEGI